MLRATLVWTVMLAVAQLPLVSAAPGEYAPLVVTAGDAPGLTAIISWLPGREMADSFRVYGVAGAPVLLSEVNATANPADLLNVVVPAGFSTYAVSGVKNGVESRMVFALGDGEDCIIIDPPDYAINCIPIIGRPVGVGIKVILP